MNTPIFDFVKAYVQASPTRLHMPGHKGVNFLGAEVLDITEIHGMNSLYDGVGVIAQSEANASSLFGANTFYSTEGSSLCIRSMLYLVSLAAREKGEHPTILATRNVHKSFLSGVALLDIAVTWLYPEVDNSYLSAPLTPSALEEYLSTHPLPHALYITTPDYLGCMVDVRGLAQVCHQYGIYLLVDNAHGAYLKFLEESQHPIDLGADLCCDSAHKTLAALTGGAYLHVAHSAPKGWVSQAKGAMALFGSTSPSFLILESLDLLNLYLEKGYREDLQALLPRVKTLKEALVQAGYTLVGDEPLKVTLATKSYGYTGQEVAEHLREGGVECEFSDPDYVVLMLTPQLDVTDMEHLTSLLCNLSKRDPCLTTPPKQARPMKAMSVRGATLAPCETILAKDSLGHILATATVSCPPAVPVLMCGEVIGEDAVQAFAYYGIKTISVVK